MTMYECAVMYDAYYDHFLDEVTGLVNVSRNDKIATDAARKMAKIAVDALAKIERRAEEAKRKIGKGRAK